MFKPFSFINVEQHSLPYSLYLINVKQYPLSYSNTKLVISMDPTANFASKSKFLAKSSSKSYLQTPIAFEKDFSEVQRHQVEYP